MSATLKRDNFLIMAAEGHRGFSPEGLKRVEEMVKRGYDRRALIPGRDGNPIFDPELSDFIAGRYGGPKPTEAEIEAERGRTIRGAQMPQDHSLLELPSVVKPATVKAVLAERLRVQQIADRWASASPRKLKALEANGTLLDRLRKQAEIEDRTLADARVGGLMADVPDSEILAMHDVPLLPGKPETQESDDLDAELQATLNDLGRWVKKYMPAADESLNQDTASETYTVLVLDNFHPYDPDEEIKVNGFKTLQAAREYARRRTRDSLEVLRPETEDADELYDRWMTYGERCLVIGDGYSAGKEIDYFIAHPATAEERDWAPLIPRSAL